MVRSSFVVGRVALFNYMDRQMLSTITIAFSSFIGGIAGGILSDRWVLKNIRGRVYTGVIGLGLTIPALLLLGFGHSLVAVVGAGMLFGIGIGVPTLFFASEDGQYGIKYFHLFYNIKLIL